MPADPLEGLDLLAGDAKRTGRSVRGVARWAHNPSCGTNNAAFAARVDLDHLLDGTDYQVEFGQSRFAIARGQRVEQIAREDDYSKTFEVLDEVFGHDPGRVTLDLRTGFGVGNAALDKRADATREAVAGIVAGNKGAVNLIDGAVFVADIGGYRARLEADTLGARTGPEFHVVEFKSWAKVDGQFADAGKVGDALRQMGLYQMLMAELVEDLGGDPDAIVSDTGLLVTPRNVGLQLAGSPLPLGRARTVAATTLEALPRPTDYASDIDPTATFGPVADLESPQDDRLEVLERVTEVYGVEYRQSCLSSCGLAKFCRSRARLADSPEVCGSGVVRMLPGVRSLRRAADLAAGAEPNADEAETGVAEVLTDTARVYEAALEGVEST